MNKRKGLHDFRFIAWLLVLLAACTPLAGTASSTPLGIGSTIQATGTSTPTATQITLLPTQTPTLVPTWTPLPTLAGDAADEAFHQWLLGSADCRFPCFAGIRLGETTWQEALQLLSPVVTFGRSSAGEYQFDICGVAFWSYSFDEKKYDGSVYKEKNGFVYAMTMHSSFDYPYELGIYNILSTYGQPDRIYIYAFSTTVLSDPPFFRLYLLYIDERFVIQYRFPATLVNGNITACDLPNIEFVVPYVSFDLLIASYGEEDWTDLSIYYGLHEYATQKVDIRPISDATGMEIEEFYLNALEEDEDGFCISTPSEDW